MIERIGNCRIVEEVGSGGMAVVYKAVQDQLGRTVAVKALKSNIAQDSQFAARFEREARFMAAFQQENIINVHDFIKKDDSMYMVMEYVEGVDLYDLVDGEKSLTAEVSAIIALQVARALNHAHFKGVIHRDIKPANIMISIQGEVKLMDFGIARADTLSDLTETGTGLGTPSYMSPEQILGEKLDSRSDIWSLGVVFYQMLTGKKPFQEDAKRSVLQKIRLERYIPARKINPEVPRNLERILARCMAKIPADRYPSMQALIHDLEDFLASRVALNYNAFIVSFLQGRGVISDNEAGAILSTGGARIDQPRGFREDRNGLQTIGLVYAVTLALLVFVGLAIQLTASDDLGTKNETSIGIALSPAEVGYLKVVATPWADIKIDGEYFATTPLARPLALAPGTHFVELVHPVFKNKKREIAILAGQTTEVLEHLSEKTAEVGR
jgi:serine/threonine-protein kinase